MFILGCSLGEQRRNMESMRITKENQTILFRLRQCKAHYSVRSWNKDWLETAKLMDSIACFPRARTNQAKVTIFILCYDEALLHSLWQYECSFTHQNQINNVKIYIMNNK